MVKLGCKSTNNLFGIANGLLNKLYSYMDSCIKITFSLGLVDLLTMNDLRITTYTIFSFTYSVRVYILNF